MMFNNIHNLTTTWQQSALSLFLTLAFSLYLPFSPPIEMYLSTLVDAITSGLTEVKQTCGREMYSRPSLMLFSYET